MTTDAELRRKLAEGDRQAVATFLDRHYAVALFYARVLGDDDDAAEVVAEAAEEVLRAVRGGETTLDLRTALVRAISARLPGVRGDDEPPSAPLGSFLPQGDPWEGWWDDPPPDWQQAEPPSPDQVIGALRRLPLQQRRLLTLMDVVGLSTWEVASTFEGTTDLDLQLGAAREAYLVVIDREVAGV